MKQLNKSDNQHVFLDPEKVYFVEKFGYLVKKINGGYGGPVQEALFARINNAVNNFKTDLPNIVHNLEINRLKRISSQKKKIVPGQISEKNKLKSKSTISVRAAEATKIITKKISTVENGLLPAIQVKGDSIIQFNILDRMKHHKVPGVSIAVVKDGKLVTLAF